MSVQPFYEAQTPRAVVEIDTLPYKLDSYSIEKNAHGATNTAHVTLPIHGNPDFTAALFRDQDFSAPVYVKIKAGFGSQLNTRFYGIVDQYVATTAEDVYDVSFQCRSLASVLVDARVTTNAIGLAQTAVNFLKQQCAQYGLQVVVMLPNGYNPVTIGEVFRGTFQYGIKNVRVWDLLLQCAQFDDVDLWEENGTVYYAAPGLIQRTTVPLYWLRDVKSIEGIHAPNFNRNVQVVVRTYQPKIRQSTSATTVTNPLGGVTTSTVSRTITSSEVFGTTERVSTSTGANGQQTVTVSSTTGGAASGNAGGEITETNKERYVIYLPNQSPTRVQQYANAVWRQISMHEYAVTLDLPVTESTESNLNIRSLIDLRNHPYAMFNDTYWPRRITENFDGTDGWNYSVEAVNHELPMGAV